MQIIEILHSAEVIGTDGIKHQLAFRATISEEDDIIKSSELFINNTKNIVSKTFGLEIQQTALRLKRRKEAAMPSTAPRRHTIDTETHPNDANGH
jgi:hypothetical protein